MPTNIIMPQMGESVFEGTITRWLKKEGDYVRRDEPLLEISTDKVDTEIPSTVGGVLKKIVCPAGAKVPIHTVLAIVDESAPPPASEGRRDSKGDGAQTAPLVAAQEPPAQPAGAVPAADAGGGARRVFSSPMVRRIAEQEGIDLSGVPGTGWKGRVTKKDIEGFIANKEGGDPAPPPPPAGAAAPPAPGPAVPAAALQARVVPMSPMRARIAEHMVMSRRTSAHVATVFEADVSRIVEVREREKRDFETVYGVRLTYTPFFAAACVQAIRDFPIINSSVEGTNIVYKRDVNLGIAVALDDGLIVPVVKKAEEKSFVGLCRAIADLVARARAKKLSVEEVQGGTFTLTNPGLYGGLFGTPIINQPQVAIMAVGVIQKRPVVVHDAIAIRSMCYLALSFDHRVIDGAVADQFMARVKDILQQWTIPVR